MTIRADDVLERLCAAGVIGPLDVHFARTLARLSADASEAVLLGAALASRAVAQGHVCADLKTLTDRPLLDADGMPFSDVQLPPAFAWVMELGGSALVSDGSRSTPLVIDEAARLYLTRYWRYQTRLASALRSRAMKPAEDFDSSRVKASLERLFSTAGGTRPDSGQRMAAIVAILRRLAIISGGPGTGKTTTVLRILAALQEEALASGRPPLRIELLAPTGKAAARLVESIRAGKAGLDTSDAVKAAIADEASTIHRRLGFRPYAPTRFTHDVNNPLPADVVLVDEASMVDLALMTKLVDAVPRRARLILLGDKDQLASVEAGAILGDICDTRDEHRRSRDFADQVADLMPDLEPVQVGPSHTGIWDCIVHLTHGYRFDPQKGIGALARAVGQGRAEEAIELLRNDPTQSIAMVELTRIEDLRERLRAPVLESFRPYFDARDPRDRLACLGAYRILCAHRRGPFGAERINVLVRDVLARAGWIDPTSEHYAGRPIMVTRNDYQLELFNGDVGVLHRAPDGRIRAYFSGPGGEMRSFLPGRLPSHESVYAMTVHKSQGSEFDAVGLLVPPQLSPVLTRELVYTGLTRARRTVTFYGSLGVLREAIDRRIERASGLRTALWHDCDET
jgi:exodeoxyribonuclease V alpha subunit